MTAVEFLRSVRRRWLYVAVAVALGLIGAVVAIVTATPQYRANATVYFSVPIAASANDLAQGGNYAQQQLTSYAELATQPIVLKKVIAHLGLNVTVNQLGTVVSTSVSKDTVLVTISATDPIPRQAANIANAVADQLGQTVRTLAPKSVNGTPAVDYAIAGEATPPIHAYSPKRKIDLGGGLLAGLLVGVVAALIRDRADDRVWTTADLQGLPVLGNIPVDKVASRSGQSPLITNWASESARAEAFRQVRTSLQFADVDDPVQVIAVTSSLSAEGKSGVSGNLAVAFAEAGRRVLLIDADLRRPSVATYFGLEGAIGLTNVLTGQIDVDEAVQEWGDRRRLAVLPAGAIPPNPSEIVGSQRMARLLNDMRSRYDVVVIDTPPLLPVADAAVIATRVDGTLLVARHGKTRRAELRRSIGALGSVDSKILGVVLNRVPVKKRGEYGYYGTVSGSSLILVDDQLDEPDHVGADHAASGSPRVGGYAARRRSSETSDGPVENALDDVAASTDSTHQQGSVAENSDVRTR